MKNVEITILLPESLKGLFKKDIIILKDIIHFEEPKYTHIEPNYKFTVRGGIPKMIMTSLKFVVSKSNDDVLLLKDWYDLSWNNEIGQKTYMGPIVSESIILTIYDSKGYILGKMNCYQCQIEDCKYDVNGDDVEFSFSMEFFTTDYWG